MNRREFIALGSTGLAGASLVDVLASNSTWKESKEGKAKNVIVIYMSGGMAHQESFDPKYLAPKEYRGPLGTVKTNTGERFSENLKHKVDYLLSSAVFLKNQNYFLTHQHKKN